MIRWQGPLELAFDHEEVVVQSMVLVVVLHLNELVILMLVCVIVVRLLSLERYHGRPGGSWRLVLARQMAQSSRRVLIFALLRFWAFFILLFFLFLLLLFFLSCKLLQDLLDLLFLFLLSLQSLLVCLFI